MLRACLFSASVLVAACTSFDALDRGVCGNGVIEPGEDCDSNDASCVRCAVVCSKPSDCPNEDYACGVDGTCHAPGGALGQPITAGAFQVDDYTVSDVDHDGTGDVLGYSKTSIVVRHGDAAGALGAVDSTVTPSQSGPAAFGDLDHDGAKDITIVTPDGLVSYTSAFRTLQPLAVQSLIIARDQTALDVRMLFRMSAVTLGGFVVDAENRVYVLVVDLLAPDNGLVEQPCLARNGSLTTATFSPSNVDIYEARQDVFSTDFVVTLKSGTGPSAKLCVLAIHKDTFGQGQITDITPTNAAPLQQKPILADLDGDADPCPGVVSSDGGPGALRWWRGQMVASRCTLRATAQPLGDPLPAIDGFTPGATLIGRAPLEPPIAAAAKDMLVFSDGLYAFVPFQAAFTNVYRSSRKLALVATGDVTGDGKSDTVFAAENDDDLDVLLRTVNSLGNDAFQLLRLDTASQVTTLTLGDYDGNGYADIAYTEPIADFQRLMVAFGTPDRPLAPVQLGAFTGTASLTRLEFPDHVDQNSLASDLAVLQPPANGHGATLTILHGSPQRTLLPYFDPRAAKDSLFRGAVVGQFAGDPSHGDVLAIAPPAPDSPSQAGAIGVWTVPGTDSGIDGTETAGRVASGLANCVGGSTGGLCTHDTAYLAFPIAADKDVAIGIDRATDPHAAVLDPWAASATSITATAVPAITSVLPAGNAVRSLHAADFDGDGALDLIAAFAPAKGGAGSGALLVCGVTGGAPHDCQDLVPAIIASAPGTRSCADAAPARIGYRDPWTTPSAARDLVVACRDTGSTLYRVHHGANGLEIEALAHTTGVLGAVRTGDVTGDGVDDILALDGDSGAQSLVVYPQCSSRVLATCQRSSASTGGAP